MSMDLQIGQYEISLISNIKNEVGKTVHNKGSDVFGWGLSNYLRNICWGLLWDSYFHMNKCEISQ